MHPLPMMAALSLSCISLGKRELHNPTFTPSRKCMNKLTTNKMITLPSSLLQGHQTSQDHLLDGEQ